MGVESNYQRPLPELRLGILSHFRDNITILPRHPRSNMYYRHRSVGISADDLEKGPRPFDAEMFISGEKHRPGIERNLHLLFPKGIYAA